MKADQDGRRYHAEEIARFRAWKDTLPGLAAAEWEKHIDRIEAFFDVNQRDPWYRLAGTNPENLNADLLRHLRRKVAEADGLPMPPDPSWYLEQDRRHEKRMRIRERFERKERARIEKVQRTKMRTQTSRVPRKVAKAARNVKMSIRQLSLF